MSHRNDALRQCNNCSKPETSAFKLKKCKNCAAVLYCGPECQRKAWNRHKPMCRRMANPIGDLLASRYGYPNVVALGRAQSDFTRAHEWAFKSMSKAIWHLEYERCDRSAKDIPGLLRFNLRCVASNDRRPNPAERFELVNYEWVDLDKYKREVPEFWVDKENIRAEADRCYRERLRETDSYMGLITVEYTIMDFGSGSMVEFFPLLKPTSHPRLDEETKREPLLELIQFCTDSINHGFPLAWADRENDVVPVPGRFLHDSGCWEWKPFFTNWDAYQGGLRNVDQALSNLGYRIPFPELAQFLDVI